MLILYPATLIQDFIRHQSFISRVCKIFRDEIVGWWDESADNDELVVIWKPPMWDMVKDEESRYKSAAPLPIRERIKAKMYISLGEFLHGK